MLLGHRLADPGKVVDRRRGAHHSLVALGAALEAIRHFGRRRADPVGFQALQNLAPAPQYSLVRSEEFVRRTHQKVAVDVLHVDEGVRRRLHRIHVEPGANLMGHAGGGLDIVDGAEEVARGTDAHQPGPLRQLLLQQIEIEFTSLRVEGQPFDLPPEIACHREPRIHVRVMIHARQEHLSASPEVPADGT